MAWQFLATSSCQMYRPDVIYSHLMERYPPPLGQWAIEAIRWDGVDPIPPDEEPVFYAD